MEGRMEWPGEEGWEKGSCFFRFISDSSSSYSSYSSYSSPLPVSDKYYFSLNPVTFCSCASPCICPCFCPGKKGKDDKSQCVIERLLDVIERGFFFFFSCLS